MRVRFSLRNSFAPLIFVSVGVRGLAAFVSILGLTVGCSHESLTPEVSNVTASRDAPKGECVELSTVTGSTSTVHGTPEQALDDLKKETANKGGNYVRINQYSSYGTGVTGTAYRCR